MVERHIQTIKFLLKKSAYKVKDSYLMSLDYRNTRILSAILSPIRHKEYNDKSFKDLKPSVEGRSVMLKLYDKVPLVKAKALSESNRSRSFRIITENGNVYERNRRDLHRSNIEHPFQVNKKYQLFLYSR